MTKSNQREENHRICTEIGSLKRIIKIGKSLDSKWSSLALSIPLFHQQISIHLFISHHDPFTRSIPPPGRRTSTESAVQLVCDTHVLPAAGLSLPQEGMTVITLRSPHLRHHQLISQPSLPIDFIQNQYLISTKFYI